MPQLASPRNAPTVFSLSTSRPRCRVLCPVPASQLQPEKRSRHYSNRSRVACPVLASQGASYSPTVSSWSTSSLRSRVVCPVLASLGVTFCLVAQITIPFTSNLYTPIQIVHDRWGGARRIEHELVVVCAQGSDG